MSHIALKILACIATSALVMLALVSGCCTKAPRPSASVPASTAPKGNIVDDSRLICPQRSVVYLSQASGSMLSRFGELKSKLKESIQSLEAGNGQWFNVIFMVDGQAVTLFTDGCRAANESNKKLAMDYIDLAICTGSCKLSSGTEVSSRQHADLIFLISNGYFSEESEDNVLQDFKPVFANGNPQVNCVFLPTDADDFDGKKTVLSKIAEGGHGKLIEVQATTKPGGGH